MIKTTNDSREREVLEKLSSLTSLWSLEAVSILKEYRNMVLDDAAYIAEGIVKLPEHIRSIKET